MSITEAPNLRSAEDRNCGNCKFFKLIEEECGICTKHDFEAKAEYVCDDYEVGIETQIEPMPVELVMGEKSVKADDGETNSLDLEDMLVNFGSAVKSLNDISEPDYAIVYGGQDLVNDYFDKNTEYGFAGATTKRVPILFHHAQPLETKSRKRIRETSPIGEAELEITDEGVLIREAVLYNRAKYKESLAELGWSTGAANHAVVREQKADGRSYVKQWLLSELSLTPMSAEPRVSNVIALKSLITPEQGAGAREGELDKNKKSSPIMGENKMDITEEKLSEMLATASENAVKKFADSLPEVKADFEVKKIEVTKDEADQPFKSLAEQMEAVKNYANSYGQSVDARLKPLAVKAPLGLNESVPSQGQFLLQPTISSEFLKPIHEEGVFSRMVKRLPVGGNSNSGWINGADETSRANGSRWGGVQAYWRAEASQVTATKPKFRRVNWELNAVEALMYITDEQLQDASMTAEIARLSAAEELMFKVNDAILNGDGVGKPKGILNSGALISVSRAATSAIANADVLNMWQRLHPANRANSAWFVNSEAEPQLDQLYLTSSLEARYITYGVDGVMRIKGRPVFVTEYNAALGTAGDILLADMNDYLLWEKGGIQSSANPWIQWLTSEQAFKFTYRVDGQPATYSAITPFKGSNTQSPYVTLAATT